MNYPWLDDYLLSKKRAVKVYHEAFGCDRYLVGDKVFAWWHRDGKGDLIVTLKLYPPHGEMLREVYEDINPGYYLNKVHWNSIYLEGSVPDDIMRDLVDESYEIVFNSLTKKMQKEISSKKSE